MQAIDPTIFPQFRPAPCRYYPRAFEAGRLVREADSYEPVLIVLPDAASAALAAGATYEARISLPAESYILGFSATNTRTAGFELQIIDLGTGAPLLSRPVKYQNLTGQGTTSGITNPVFYLAKPRLLLEPAVLSVKIRNLDTSNANTVQLVIHATEPPCRPTA